MSRIDVLVIRTAGTNCDGETKTAFELLGARVSLIHVNELVCRRNNICDYQIVVFPGGFTYGDDIAAGKTLANEMKMKLRDELERFLSKNGLVIGICNGFQILVKMGILPGNREWRQEATLSVNDSGRFEDRWVCLKKPEAGNQKPENRGQKSEAGSRKADMCVWTKGIEEIIYLPVAHGEGKFIPDNNATLRRLAEKGQIVFQYCDQRGDLSAYPDNPNGSVEHIAGICDETGRIFGLMPHPERNVLRTHHPRWTREEQHSFPDGLKILKKGMEFLKHA